MIWVSYDSIIQSGFTALNVLCYKRVSCLFSFYFLLFLSYFWATVALSLCVSVCVCFNSVECECLKQKKQNKTKQRMTLVHKEVASLKACFWGPISSHYPKLLRAGQWDHHEFTGTGSEYHWSSALDVASHHEASRRGRSCKSDHCSRRRLFGALSWQLLRRRQTAV